MELLFYIMAGAVVGLMVGITGVGGGSLMTPILTKVFGIPLNVAVGTDLLYAALTKTSGVYTHNKQGTVRWRLVLLLASGSIPASIVTAIVLNQFFPDATAYEHLLQFSLGIMLLLTSTLLLLRPKLQVWFNRENATGEDSWLQRNAATVTFFSGIFLGIFVTLSSVGAGAICAVLLLVLYPRMPALHVVGTDITHAVPLTLIAGIGHFFLGSIDFVLLGCLLIGSIPAVHVGTKLGAKLPNNVLQPVLGVILFIIGLKYVFF